MTALAAAKGITQKNGPNWIRVGIKNGATVYHGAMIALNTSGIQATPATTALAPIGVADLITSPDPVPSTGQASVFGATTGQKLVGTSDGSAFFLIRQGTFLMAQKSGDEVTTADLGKDCYVTDDATVQHTSGGAVAGKVVDVTSEGVWVNIGAGCHFGEM
jgi:predicted RecA/RadA family phage recombinase